MSNQKISSREINGKLAEKVKNYNFSEGKRELSSEQLDGVTGGVDSFAFSMDGNAYVGYCYHADTTQGRDIMYSLTNDKPCKFAPEGVDDRDVCNRLCKIQANSIGYYFVAVLVENTLQCYTI